MSETSEGWVERPWGKYLTVYQAPGLWVKTIVINPWSRLSLQIHRSRDELWHSAEAGLRAYIGDNYLDLDPDLVYTVPRMTEHRLINTSRYSLSLVEVATGEPDEEDILRIDDDYGRGY